MKNLNRRNWLKLSGFAGAASLLNTNSALAATPAATPFTENGVIRLSSNENPYGPSQKVRAAINNAYDIVCRYPYGWYKELVGMLAKKHGVAPNNIMLTAGSTEGLKMAGLVYGSNGGEIVSADPVFLSLLRYAEHFGAYIHKVPLRKDFTHDLEAMEQRITLATKLVYICNPNNPASTLQSANEVEAFCTAVSDRTMVFSDEAYFDYIADPSYPSMIELVKKGENVIVARTFSKVFGLAGIRIGYLVARPDIIERIGKSVMSGPNILAVMAAKAALEDEEFYKFSLEKNAIGRKMVTETLDHLKMEYATSSTNFVFFKTGRPIEAVHADFMKQGVQVGRPFPPLTDWCRVSIGKVEEVEQLCAAMKKVFA
jgi:histidinol-phosphate aminotransferase